MNQVDHSHGGEGTARNRSSSRVLRIALWCFALLFLSASAFCLLQFGRDTGVGDAEQAQRKIRVGMSKAEVRAALGRPHRGEGNEWDYWDSALVVGCVLRVHFGDDDRVTDSEWWVN